MSFLKILSSEHSDVLKRTQLFEKAALQCFENKKNLSKEEYLEIVTPCRTLFGAGLAVHFKFEEMALFPVIIRKSKEAEQTVRNLILDHKLMMRKFSEFEAVTDYNLSIQLLNGLMKDLAFHAEKEEGFFSSIHLSKDEAAKIDEVACALGYKIQ